MLLSLNTLEKRNLLNACLYWQSLETQPSNVWHTHGDAGGDAPLTHRWVFRQLKLFGHNSVDAFHIQPLSEQISSRVLTHVSSTSQVKSTRSWQDFGLPLTLTAMSTGPLLGFPSGLMDTTLILTTCPGQYLGLSIWMKMAKHLGTKCSSVLLEKTSTPLMCPLTFRKQGLRWLDSLCWIYNGNHSVQEDLNVCDYFWL